MMSFEYKQDGSQSRLVGMLVSFKLFYLAQVSLQLLLKSITLGCRQLDWCWSQQIPLSLYVQAQVGWGWKRRDEVEHQATTPGSGRKRLDRAGISQMESHGPTVRGEELFVLKVTTRGHVPFAWTLIELMFLMFLCLFKLASVYIIFFFMICVYTLYYTAQLFALNTDVPVPPQGSVYPKEMSKIKWTASKQERLSSLCAEGGFFPCSF